MKKFLVLSLTILSLNFYGQTDKKYPIEEQKARKKVVQDSLATIEKTYTDAIKLNGEDADLYYKRAKCWMRMAEASLDNSTTMFFGTNKDFSDKYDKAEKDLKKTVKLNPAAKYIDTAHYLMGLIKINFMLANDEDFHKGVKYLTKAIELNPNYAEAYYLRGKTRYYLNQYYECLADLNKAIALNTKNLADAYYFRGLCKFGFSGFRVTTFKDDKEGACTDLTKAVSLGSTGAKTSMQKNCK